MKAKTKAKIKYSAFIIIAFLTIFILAFFCGEIKIYAMDASDFDLFPSENSTQNPQSKSEMGDIIKEQLESLNLENFDEYINQNGEIFQFDSFKTCVEKLVKGEFFGSGQTFFDGVISVFFCELKSLLPTFITILAITILISVLSGFASDFLSEDMQGVVSFALVLLVTAISIPTVIATAKEIKSAISALSTQAETAFPILLTLVFTLGGSASQACFSPLLYTLSNVIIKVVSGWIFPIFMFVLGVNIINAISPNLKISSVSDFCISISKYVLGVSFTVFSACMALGGISAGSFDSVSYRTAKYAIANSVPMIGGYVRDGFDLILYSGVLVKNAVGVGFVLLAIVSAFAPLAKILCGIWLFRLVEAISSPFTTPQITTFYKNIAKSMSLVATAYIAVLFMYTVAIIMLMISTNILF